MMKNRHFLKILFIIFISSFAFSFNNQNANAAQSKSVNDILKSAANNFRAKTMYTETKMILVRPSWKREISMKSWSKSDDYTLVLITSPEKEKGITFLKRKKELWNWIPSIERLVKLSSSMMGEAWMGSDFTNGDIIRDSSIEKSYKYKLDKTENIRGTNCYKVIFTAKENAAVVWGQILTWISVDDYVQHKTEFYDEDNVLINTINAYDIKLFGKRKLATRLEMIPESKPGYSTIMTIQKYEFEIPIKDSFFTQENMKVVK